MIFRFSAYGFLKNLRLFEAFLVLALLERGLDFFAIGGLIAIREVTVNLFEIPSGVLADSVGRKRCMVASMAFYIVAYLLLGLATPYVLLALAMVAYGMADAFRSGTHKALIYAWLRANGRESERTKIYGYTRSWSKAGSAMSAIIAGAVVYFSQSYTSVFLWSTLPAVINLLNLATYPASLDRDRPKGPGVGSAWTVFKVSLRETFGSRPLRRLIVDSATMEGTYAAAKDYLQPVVQHAAIALPIFVSASNQQRTAILGAAAYALLFMGTSIASRQAHRWESAHRNTESAVRRLFVLAVAAYALLAVGLLVSFEWLAIGMFVAMGLIQNLWRPIHVGRFDRDGPEHLGATVLSVESQSKALTAAVLAPLIGVMVDLLTAGETPIPLPGLLPVALCGLIVVAGYIAHRMRPRQN